MRNIIKYIGPGFIATLAGLEITNVVIFTKIGAVYGITGFIIATLMVLPLTYLQQVIQLPIITTGNSIFLYLRRKKPRLWLFTLTTIYIASIITLLVNIIGLAIILSILIGGSWAYYSMLITTVIWAIYSNSDIKGKVNTVLSLLSIFLIIYVALFIIHLPTILSRPIVLEKIGFFDILALWGAAASPYSLLMIGESREDLKGIYVGSVALALIGIAIASVGYIYLYPSPYFTIGDSIKPLYSLGVIPTIIYIIGISSSVLLAGLAILSTCKSMLIKILITRKPPKLASSVENTIAHLVIANIIVTIVFARIMGTTNYRLYTNIILVGTATIGLLFTLSLIGITYFYRSHREGGILFKFNTIYLYVITIISLILSFLGMIEAINI